MIKNQLIKYRISKKKVKRLIKYLKTYLFKIDMSVYNYDEYINKVFLEFNKK